MDNKTAAKDLVFKAIAENGHLGLTCDEAEHRLHMTHQTCSARVNELMRSGAIVKAAFQRKTSSGRFAAVWVTPEHKEVM